MIQKVIVPTCNPTLLGLVEVVEWRFSALSASKAIFRARTYNCNLFNPVMMMNETRRKPTTGRQSPPLFDKWHGIFYMPSRIDEAGHTKAFDYPVAEHWGESQRTKLSLVGFEPTSAHTYESEIQRSTLLGSPAFIKGVGKWVGGWGGGAKAPLNIWIKKQRKEEASYLQKGIPLSDSPLLKPPPHSKTCLRP